MTLFDVMSCKCNYESFCLPGKASGQCSKNLIQTTLAPSSCKWSLAISCCKASTVGASLVIHGFPMALKEAALLWFLILVCKPREPQHYGLLLGLR